MDENTSAMSVATYGNAPRTAIGIPENAGRILPMFAIVMHSPKKAVEPRIPSGFHCPKMRAAIARKPRPLIPAPALYSPAYVTRMHAPPRPERKPYVSTPMYHLMDVDTGRCNCGRMLTASPESEAEACLIKEEVAGDPDRDADPGSPVGLREEQGADDGDL